jgi:hypothetical protein
MTAEQKINAENIIIGGGLSGLLIAKGLKDAGQDFLILEASDRLGGSFFTGGLRLLPVSELTPMAVRFFNQISGQNYSAEINSDVVTFENKEILPFVGFGEFAPEYYENLFPFTKGYAKDVLGFENWVRQISQELSEKTLFNSRVIKAAELAGHVDFLELSSKKIIRGNRYFYCADPSEFKLIVPQTKLAHKNVVKFLKGPFWTQISVDLVHKQIPNNLPLETLFVLNSSNKNEAVSAMGLFYKSNDTIKSQWFTLVDDQFSEDTEQLGKSVQNFRKLLKKHIPGLFESAEHEKLILTPALFKSSSWNLNGNGTLQDFNNFWIGSGIANEQPGLLGTLLQAQFILAAVQNTASADQQPLEPQILDQTENL